MTIKIITLDTKNEANSPSIRLVRSNPTTPGTCTNPFTLSELGSWAGSEVGGVNSSAAQVARLLATKVGNRSVEVELQIQPYMPPIGIPEAELIPLMSCIAENASASVEPGPSKVSLCTWWEGTLVGLDAVGHEGNIDPAVRDRLLMPGFTTRVGDWDTGFGMFEATTRAERFGANISLMEYDSGVLFRLSLPISQAAPMSPDNLEAQVALRTYERHSPYPQTRNDDLWVGIAGQEVLGHGSGSSHIEA